jgi:hypothetical protein
MKQIAKEQKKIPVSEKSLDMLESAVSQLAYREPEWRKSAMVFARAAGLQKTVAIINHLWAVEDGRQQEFPHFQQEFPHEAQLIHRDEN